MQLLLLPLLLPLLLLLLHTCMRTCANKYPRVHMGAHTHACKRT